jgi:hypothetical protein
VAAGVGLRLAGRFLGNAVSESFAFAAGVAIGPVLGPPTQALRNSVNAAFPFVPIGPGVLAEGVAQGKIDHDVASGIARESGISGDNFDRMVAIARVGPGVGQAFELWRRGVVDEAGFRGALELLGLAEQWVDDLVQIKRQLLAPDELARAIHRGLIADPGLLQGTLPGGVGHVPAYPVYPVDAIAEAAGWGYTRDELGVLVGLQGLPMGSHEAAQGLFRGVLTHDDYLRAIAEGNTRNEWAAAILAQSRQIPTARDFLENTLRGYSTLAEAIAGAELHGMTPEHATLIYQNQGRPMNVHAITQALARGGVFKPEPGEITDPYLASIVEGNLKPAYYDLQHSLRYTVPGTFAIRALAESGVWDEAKTAERLKWSGWFPQDADEVAHAWAGGGGATVDAHVGKAQTQLWNTAHRVFLAHRLPAGQAASVLERAGVAATAVATVLDIWGVERGLIRAELTAKQITKAVADGVHNPATGAPWTRDEAIAALLELGYDAADAAVLVDEG